MACNKIESSSGNEKERMINDFDSCVKLVITIALLSTLDQRIVGKGKARNNRKKAC